MNQYTTDEAPHWINDAWLTGWRHEWRWRCYLPHSLCLSLCMCVCLTHSSLTHSFLHWKPLLCCFTWSISLCSVKEEFDSNRITQSFVHFAFVALSTLSQLHKSAVCTLKTVERVAAVLLWIGNGCERKCGYWFQSFGMHSCSNLLHNSCVPLFCEFFNVGIRATTFPLAVVEHDD